MDLVSRKTRFVPTIRRRNYCSGDVERLNETKNMESASLGPKSDQDPQPLETPTNVVLNMRGSEVEIIGVHLKSKINQKKPFQDGELTDDYVEAAIKARVKLATEAYDIMRYIERRFEQSANPRIFVCGNMNDGPGREHFERQYLFSDLVSNIQGDMFFARRYLYRALFDFNEHLRWSTKFRDQVEKWARSQPEAESFPSTPIDSTKFQLIFTYCLVSVAFYMNILLVTIIHLFENLTLLR